MLSIMKKSTDEAEVELEVEKWLEHVRATTQMVRIRMLNLQQEMASTMSKMLLGYRNMRLHP